MAFEDDTRPPAGSEQAAARRAPELAGDDGAGADSGQGSDRFVNAAPYERTPARRGHRNGSYARTLQTRVGSSIAIPAIGPGSSGPPCSPNTSAANRRWSWRWSMYFHGVSTRKVSAVVEQLCGTTISASEVSALTRKLDASLTAWRERRLTDTAYAALVVDTPISSRSAAKAMCGPPPRCGWSASRRKATGSISACGSGPARPRRAGATCSRTWSSAACTASATSWPMTTWASPRRSAAISPRRCASAARSTTSATP